MPRSFGFGFPTLIPSSGIVTINVAGGSGIDISLLIEVPSQSAWMLRSTQDGNPAPDTSGVAFHDLPTVFLGS